MTIEEGSPPAETGTDAGTEPANGRRLLLTKGGIAAAVAAVAGAGLAREVRAADGDTLLVGNDHTGSTPGSETTIEGSTFSVSNGTSSQGSIVGWTGFSGSTTIGVSGLATIAEGVGLQGESSGFGNPNGRGVLGNDSTDDGVAVYGQHGPTFPGTGLRAESANGTGIVAMGGLPAPSGLVDSMADDPVDVSLAGTGLLEFTATQATTATTDGVAGRLVRGTDGNLWFSVGADSWEQLTGLPAPPTSTSQTFTSFQPYRAYDSRFDAAGPLDAGTDRTLSVKDARDLATGAIVDTDILPAGATAISFNLTAIGTAGTGFIAITPGSASDFGASAINWSGPTNIANAGIVAVDGSLQVKVFAGPGGSANVALDVTGYWS